jgi:uncharacterized protein YndB with AHSA1/START domain
MANENELRLEIPINASISMTWDALTNPDLIKQYFFGTNLITTWEIGSPIIFSGEWEGKPYEDKGVILDYQFEKLLKYNYWSNFSGTEDIPENYADISYQLSDNKGVTILVITQTGFKNLEAVEHSRTNWISIMNEIKEMIE